MLDKYIGAAIMSAVLCVLFWFIYRYIPIGVDWLYSHPQYHKEIYGFSALYLIFTLLIANWPDKKGK